MSIDRDEVMPGFPVSQAVANRKFEKLIAAGVPESEIQTCEICRQPIDPTKCKWVWFNANTWHFLKADEAAQEKKEHPNWAPPIDIVPIGPECFRKAGSKLKGDDVPRPKNEARESFAEDGDKKDFAVTHDNFDEIMDKLRAGKMMIVVASMTKPIVIRKRDIKKWDDRNLVLLKKAKDGRGFYVARGRNFDFIFPGHLRAVPPDDPIFQEAREPSGMVVMDSTGLLNGI